MSINQKRLNFFWSKITGTSPDGVTLDDRIRALIEDRGCDVPHKRKDREKLAKQLMHLGGAVTKSLAFSAKSNRPNKTSGRKCLEKGRAKADSFYSTWEWKRARYKALKSNGHRCQCCGWQPGDTAHGHLVVDHIKPRSKHPELELDVTNLQILCNDCNMGKSNVYEDDFRRHQDAMQTILAQ